MAEPFHRLKTLRRKSRRWASRRTVRSRAIIAVVVVLVGGGITTLVPPMALIGATPTVLGGISNHAFEMPRFLPPSETQRRVAEVRPGVLTPLATRTIPVEPRYSYSRDVTGARTSVGKGDPSLLGVSDYPCDATSNAASVPEGRICPLGHSSAGPANPDWTVAIPTANPSSIDLGQSTNFTAILDNKGKLANFTYIWLGLPPGCSSRNGTRVHCTPTATGTFSVSVNVTLGNDSLISDPVKLKVYVDPTLTSFGASPSTLLVDTSTTFTVQESFGLSPFQYSYSGLPSGCTSKNSATFSCTPTQTGKFTVEVNFEDAAGLTAALNTTISVTPRVLGLAPLVGYAVIGGTVAFLALVVFILVIVRMRRRRLGKKPARGVQAQEKPAPSDSTPQVAPQQIPPPPPDSP